MLAEVLGRHSRTHATGTLDSPGVVLTPGASTLALGESPVAACSWL